MARDRSRSIITSRTTLADGTVRIYRYAGVGGPRLPGEPGSPEFEAALSATVQQRRHGATNGKLSGLVIAYRGSPEFAALAASTKKERARFLDLIQDEDSRLSIGSLPIEALGQPRVRQHLLAWRDQWRATPRKADYAVQVLSALLSWGTARGMISTNVLIGSSNLYKNDRADQVWTPEEISRFVGAAPSPEVGFIVRLAALTGLRRGDLLRLSWSDVGDIAIVLMPSKSKGRRRPKKAVIPLLDEALALLSEIREQQGRRWTELKAAAEAKGRMPPPKPTTVLTSTRARAWSANGAEHQVIDTKDKAGIDKHLHDCRGTFATRLRMDGATASEIADVLGWEEERVERLLAAYREGLMNAMINTTTTGANLIALRRAVDDAISSDRRRDPSHSPPASRARRLDHL